VWIYLVLGFFRKFSISEIPIENSSPAIIQLFILESVEFKAVDDWGCNYFWIDRYWVEEGWEPFCGIKLLILV
jgi:hypothetical protein